MVIAVDFDGTLFENEYPKIGKPKLDVIKWCIKQKEAGHKLTLWTCREDEMLLQANTACASYGLIFDHINSNDPNRMKLWNNDCRKIGADIYLDDKVFRPDELEKAETYLEEHDFNG